MLGLSVNVVSENIVVVKSSCCTTIEHIFKGYRSEFGIEWCNIFGEQCLINRVFIHSSQFFNLLFNFLIEIISIRLVKSLQAVMKKIWGKVLIVIQEEEFLVEFNDVLAVFPIGNID